jgi:hypothetical protein
MIYIFLFISLAFLSCLDKVELPKDLRLLIFLTVSTVLILFLGLRGNIEPDYANYQHIYNASSSSYSPKLNIEYGYFLFNKFISSIGLPFQAVLFIMAVPSLAGKTYFFEKYSPNFSLSVLIYFSTLFFLFDFIAIRQAVALSIFLLCIPLIYERRFLLFLILMLLAAQIHISALLLIPGYFVFNLNLSNRVLLGTIIICAIINILRIKVPLIEILLNVIPVPLAAITKVTIYFAETTYAFVSLKQLLLGLAFVFMKMRSPQKNQMLDILVNIFVFGILFATLFNGLPQLSYRMKWYFFSADAILLVYLVDFIAKDDLKTTFSLYALLFILYGYSLFTFLHEIAGRGDYIFPYKLFIQ